MKLHFLLVFLNFILVAVVYLLPAGIAGWRDHPRMGWIIYLNVLLGWTVLLWWAALLWALSPAPRRRVRRVRGEVLPPEREPSSRAEWAGLDAVARELGL